VLHSEVPGAIRVIAESVPNLNVSLISDKPLYCQYKYVLSDHGNGLGPAALQHISFWVHIFLAFQIVQDLTKDKSDTTEKKHADSVLFAFVTCLLLFPELWMLATASRHKTVEHRNERRGREEQNTTISLQDPLSAMAKDMLSLLGCGRDVLKHP